MCQSTIQQMLLKGDSTRHVWQTCWVVVMVVVVVIMAVAAFVHLPVALECAAAGMKYLGRAARLHGLSCHVQLLRGFGTYLHVTPVGRGAAPALLGLLLAAYSCTICL